MCCIRQKLCSFCDKFFASMIFLGGSSTAVTTGLQYYDYIDDWRAIIISSGVTFLAILCCVLRGVQIQNTSQSSTIIINQKPIGELEEITPIEPVEVIEIVSPNK